MLTENRLLAALPQEVLERLAPHLQLVALQAGTRLHEAGETIQALYFPIDCGLSITITMSDGRTAETGLTGKRDVIGINAIMGGCTTTQTAYVVQLPGNAIKINANVLLDEFDSNKAVRDVLLRYTQALIAQLSQTTACNSLHPLEQRLARWLLEAHDRVDKKNLRLTHELLSEMLGVRRAGVTQAAQKLQESGFIQYGRGSVHILDLPALEEFACECFRTVKDEYDRLIVPRQRLSRDNQAIRNSQQALA
ncbi:Crp/Fnr family transcriptional regulator [Leptolyngbya sp. FACHB-261]|uniref:Crp/Fnr family transcriptional regulator n=1 Tax=Leptolyngbya sp. FACHB-261 TaxID=2692806 RepID=UPI001683FCBE|nr:Crp/Fnr family transcriptional regulator [Leptolyngbya sp. FACHB-261]MBD2101073.1 Crp/Fnr family transcriptional regulator [Leptolyngbya sp. FACHB-261]